MLFNPMLCFKSHASYPSINHQNPRYCGMNCASMEIISHRLPYLLDTRLNNSVKIPLCFLKLNDYFQYSSLRMAYLSSK